MADQVSTCQIIKSKKASYLLINSGYLSIVKILEMIFQRIFDVFSDHESVDKFQ